MAGPGRISEDPRRAVCVATMTDEERDELLEAVEVNFAASSGGLLPLEAKGR
jgi:hypothetical protein